MTSRQFWNRYMLPLLRGITRFLLGIVRGIANFFYEIGRDQIAKPIRAWLKKRFFWIAGAGILVFLANTNPAALEQLLTAVLPLIFLYVGFQILMGKKPFMKGGKKKKKRR